MKKYLLIAALVSCYAIPALSQYPSFSKADSLKINNLRNILPTLKGRERVDALNHLCELFESFYKVGGIKPKKESINSIHDYAQKANKEAEELDYKYGIARSLFHLTFVLQKKDTIGKKYLHQVAMLGEDLLNENIAGKESIKNDNEYEVAISLLALSEANSNLLMNSGGKIDTATKKYLQRTIAIGEKLQNDSIIGAAYFCLGSPLEDRETNYKKALLHFQKAGDLRWETIITTLLGMLYHFEGRYEEAFPYWDKSVQLSQANAKKDSSNVGDEYVQWSYFNMSLLFEAAGDYETAMDFLLKAHNYGIEKNLPWKLNLAVSELYCKMNKTDSALAYWSIWKRDWDSYEEGLQSYGDVLRAEIYIKDNQPEGAMPILERCISHYEKLGEINSGALMRPLLLRAEAYSQRKNYPLALQDATAAIKYAKLNNGRQYLMDGYLLSSSIDYRLGKYKDAYEALTKYHVIKDSIQNRQFLIRLNNYKRQVGNAKNEARILLLNKDNQIKEAQLKQASTTKNFLIEGLFVLLIAGIFIYRGIALKRKNEKLQRYQLENEMTLQQLENEKKQAELQQQAVELEMQALRAQMNPHFIFNCLSSINRIILKNESKTASDYLTRFSRLIRLVLINSQKTMIPLEDELQMLRLYLDMERLRFKNSFDYVISFVNEIDAGAILIPPLLLQPFCENAVWHGLMQKEGQGHLSIDLSMQENILHCIIADDGIGREKAAELKSKSAEKEKSMGLKITTQRLALLNRDKQVQTFFTIEDIVDENTNVAGTKVILKICYKELAEELSY